jgi:hypothetical protein
MIPFRVHGKWRFLALFGALKRDFMIDLYARKKFTTSEPTKRRTQGGDAYKAGRRPAVLLLSLMCPSSRAARRNNYPPYSIIRAAYYLVTAFPVFLQTAIGTIVTNIRSGTAGHPGPRLKWRSSVDCSYSEAPGSVLGFGFGVEVRGRGDQPELPVFDGRSLRLRVQPTGHVVEPSVASPWGASLNRCARKYGGID